VWGADITMDTNPFQAGLGFAVKLDKGEFIGRKALLERREQPAETKLACVVLDDPRAVALGSEPVRVDGDVVGRVTSGGFGYTVQKSIVYAYVPTKVALDSNVEVDIFGTWISGRVVRDPLFDPEGLKIRA